jgi:DNA-binding TFAR19-related protein (PDSD5 family)
LSEEDSELERLKAKRLAEMQKNISTKEETESTPKTTKEIISENPRDSIIKVLGFRWKMLNPNFLMKQK